MLVSFYFNSFQIIILMVEEQGLNSNVLFPVFILRALCNEVLNYVFDILFLFQWIHFLFKN